jgi:hypothetical protein
MSKYAVTPQYNGTNSSDILVHESMVEAVKDMVLIGKWKPDNCGPITTHIELVS